MAPPSEWPKYIKPLVDQYGAAQVWRCGLEYLQYPPDLIHTPGEVFHLQIFMKEKQKAAANHGR